LRIDACSLGRFSWRRNSKCHLKPIGHIKPIGHANCEPDVEPDVEPDSFAGGIRFAI